MPTDPTRNEVDSAIYSVAARSLDGQPTGTVVQVNGVIGYKKMPFWWNYRVYGLRAALRQVWRDYKAKKEL